MAYSPVESDYLLYGVGGIKRRNALRLILAGIMARWRRRVMRRRHGDEINATLARRNQKKHHVLVTRRRDSQEPNKREEVLSMRKRNA